MSLIHRHTPFFDVPQWCQDFDRRISEHMNRHFEEMDRHFPRSFLDRDLWFSRPRFESFHSRFEDFDREMKRHFEEMDRHFAEVMRKSGLEIDRIGHRENVSAPKIVDGRDGRKNVALDINLPKNIDPSKINVTVSNGDIIIQAEDKVEKPNESSQMHYYRRSTLPPNTDYERLKADLINGNQLSITAPLNENAIGPQRTIPVTYKK